MKARQMKKWLAAALVACAGILGANAEETVVASGEKEFALLPPVTLTGLSATAITYGQTLAASRISGTATATDFGTVAGTIAWASSSTAPKVSDSQKTTYSVRFTPSNANHSKTGSATLKLTVNAKAITPSVTLSKTSATYGDSGWNTLPTVTVTGDSKTLVSGTDYTASWSPSPVSGAGTYTVTVALKGNYSGSKTATYTVNKKALTVTANAKNTSVTYGDAAPGYTLAYSGWVNNEGTSTGSSLITTAPTATTTYTTTTGAGSTMYYYTPAGGNELTNYSYSHQKGTGFTVNVKTITVTPKDGQSKTYGDSDPMLTYDYTPSLVGTDAFTGALSRTSGETVGTYAITQGTLQLNDNYTLSFTAGKTFAITKSKDKPFADEKDPEGAGYKMPTDPNDWTSLTNKAAYSAFDCVTNYDGLAHTIDTNALVAAYTAACVAAPAIAYSSDTNADDWAAAPVELVDAGATSVWYRVSVPNYEDLVRVAKVVVAPRAVTLTSGSQQWTYDGRAHSNVTVTVGGEGFVAGEGVLTNGFATITDVGGVPNAFSYEFLANTKPENYIVTRVAGTLTVVKSETQKEIEEAFGGGVVVNPVVDDDGNVTNYVVTVTNDITGPVVVPGDLDSVPVTVDLNGHDITGTNGVTTAEGEGTDGGPAIVVGAGTELTLVGPGTVAGGKGGAGNPAGKGGPGVVVEEGGTVNVGGGVEVSGGTGGSGVTGEDGNGTAGGDGGTGVEGEVGTNDGEISGGEGGAGGEGVVPGEPGKPGKSVSSDEPEVDSVAVTAIAVGDGGLTLTVEVTFKAEITTDAFATWAKDNIKVKSSNVLTGLDGAEAKGLEPSAIGAAVCVGVSATAELTVPKPEGGGSGFFRVDVGDE